MSQSTPEAKQIFLEAIEKQSPEELSRYLDAACQDQPGLRSRVEELLRGHQAAGHFLGGSGVNDPTAGPLATDHSGAQVGPYKLLQQIGEGGMGVVYMAEQIVPVERRVALKIIKPGMDTRQVIARFEAERQALAMMDHPNIAKVFDAGTTDAGRPYFVMELVRGIPITKYCDEHQLTLKQRLTLFLPVCHAVQHAHQKGIIHRDLKPSNVLVAQYDDQPVPKVIDFGVAKAAQKLTEQTMFTEFGQVLGTLEYMSPEQAQLNQLDIDTRSDIYSLGVLLYELLTGCTPFDGKHLRSAAFDEMLRIIREEEPPKPSTRLSTAVTLPSIAVSRNVEPVRLGLVLRGELDWIVMKALEKDRNRRYATANGFAADVQRYLNDETVQACPPSMAYLLRKFVRRNKGPVLAVALVLLALVGGIIGTTLGMLRATNAEANAVNETKQKVAALEAAQQSERDAKDQLVLALWSQARAGRFNRHMGQRLDSLDALSKAARIRPDERLRDEAIAAMALPDVRRATGWHSSAPATPAVAYGRQYKIYARMDEPDIISIRTIPDDREVQRIASGTILGTYLHFSPDERFLLGLGEGYAMRVWRVADGQSMLPADLRDCRAHAFSMNSRQLAIGQQDWILYFDLAKGQEVQRWRIAAPAHTLAFHPDHCQVAVGYFNPGVASVYDAKNGDLLADLPVGDMSNQVVAWHPQGERLAVAGSDPRIQIWNVAAKRKVATLEGHVQYVPVVTFHPGGDLLASHGWDGKLLLWDASSGRQLMRLTSLSAPQFSADGRWLGVAWHRDRADLLEVTPSREYRTLVSGVGAGANYGDISPDGRLLAMSTYGRAQLCDLRDGRELASLPAGTTFVFFDGIGRRDGPVPSERAPQALLTGGSGGLQRWPITRDDPEHMHLRLGPPQQLSSLRRAWFARTPDGRTLAAVTEEGAANKILDLETATVRRDLGGHPLGEVRALSVDGRWAASSGWHSDQVRLWNVNTGQIVHEWVLGKRANVFFTPDSRALVIARDDEFSFWDVATLQPILRLARDVAQFPGHVAFSPDGQLMALEMAPAVIHLKEVTTGRTVAQLEDPHGDRAAWLGFTPDGTQLVAAASLSSAIHNWDLRAIRQRLKGMGLDWNWPEYPPRPDDPVERFAETALKIKIIVQPQTTQKSDKDKP